MATTTPNFGWSVPTSTDLVKDGATAIETLGDSIDASLLDLKGGTSGQVLAKNSGTDMDFVWVTTDDTNAIQNAIVDAKGDLIGATAADTPARLAVGTNGQVLTADSTAATGLAWATPATGGGMTLLSTTTLSGSSTTISSISQDYKTLYAVITGYTHSGTNDALAVRPNGVTTGIATSVYYSIGTTTYNTAYTNSAFWVNFVGITPSDAENSCVLQIDNYTSTSTNKPMFAYAQCLASGGSQATSMTFGGDRQNSAISSLEFLINTSGTSFTAGTVLLYGVK